MSGAVKSQRSLQKLPSLRPPVGGVGGTQALQLPTRSTSVAIRGQHHLTALCWKRESRSAKVIFFDAMPLWPAFVHYLIALGCFFFFKAVIRGLSGANEMMWFLAICKGPLREHVKSFGTPCRVVVGLSGNKLSGTWTLPTMTFLTN